MTIKVRNDNRVGSTNYHFPIRMNPVDVEETDEIIPQVHDVMIGRSRGARNHYGTQRFHGMLQRSRRLCSMNWKQVLTN